MTLTSAGQQRRSTAAPVISDSNMLATTDLLFYNDRFNRVAEDTEIRFTALQNTFFDNLDARFIFHTRVLLSIILRNIYCCDFRMLNNLAHAPQYMLLNQILYRFTLTWKEKCNHQFSLL